MTTISSILNDTKQVLNVEISDTNFDIDIIMHINSALSRLMDLGVGPAIGVQVTGTTEDWSLIIGSDKGLNRVKTFVYLYVRLLFDPPQTGHHMTAAKEQIDKQEWLLNVHMEPTIYVDPNPE